MAYTIEQMRSSADQVVNSQIENLTPQEQQELQDRFGPQFDVVRAQTLEAKNRLKLTMFAHSLEGVSNIDYESWIINNVKATQILINRIRPGSLHYWVDANGVKNNDGRGSLRTGEDGIYGEMTQRCVLALFGLNVPVPVRTTPTVVPPATGAVVTSLRPQLRPTNGVEVPEGGIVISPEMLANQELMDRIRAAGITINGNRAEIENPRMLEHFEEYLDLLNFIEDVPRESSNAEIRGVDNKNKLIDNYVKLINEGTDFLTEDLKEVLKYKYAEAIYNDVIRMGGYITEVEDGTTGEYTILDITTGDVMEDNPYMRVLSESNTRNLLDVAMVISMVRKNHSLNEAPIVGDASLIKGLLEQHEIKDASGLQIIEARLLLLNKDLVLTQIEEKITRLREGGNASAQAFQELEFLKRYVEKGETPRVNYMRTILTQVNEYKGFLDHQATIDGDWDPADFAHASEEDMTDRIASAIKGNKLGLIVIGIIAWLMGYKKVALGTLGLGIFSGTVGDIIHGAGKAALTDTDLELVRIGDVTQPLDNPLYQDTYSTLADLNRNNISAQQIDSNNNSLAPISNDTLFNIVNDVTRDEIEVSFEGTNSEIVSDLSAKLIGADGTPKYSDEDLSAFVALIRQSGIEDTGDQTLLDVLTSGVDRLGQVYSSDWFDFTENATISSAIHTSYRTAWDAANREERRELLKVIEATDAHLYSGTIDAAEDAWSAAPGVVSGTINIFAETTGVPVQQRIDKIGELRSFIQASSIDGEVQAEILNLLLQNETLLKKQNKFDELRSSWYDPETRVRFQNLTAWLRTQEQNEVNLESLRVDVTTKIGNLETLKSELPAENVYNTLRNQIQDEINHLKITQAQIISAKITNSDIDSVLDDTGAVKAGIDINDTIDLGVVTGVATKIQGELHDSIDTSIETSVFGVSESDLRASIIQGYETVLEGGVNGLNASATITTNTWNSFRTVIQNSLAVSLNDSIVSNIIGNIDFIGILPPADVVIVNGSPDSGTIDQIAAQIQLQILERYFADQEARLDSMKKLKTAYEPLLDAIETGGGTLTPDQERLKELITTDYDTLQANIEAKVLELADNYEGASISNTINDLDTSLDITNLDSFVEVQQFLSSSTANDAQITFLQGQITRHFGASNSLDGILVPTSTLTASFNAKKDELKDHVETLDIVKPTEIAGMTSVTDIQDAIADVTAVQSIIGIGESNSIDAAIPALKNRFNEIADVTQIEVVKNSINTDITSLVARSAELDTEIARERGLGNNTQVLEDEKHEIDALVVVLRDARDTPRNISYLRQALERYTDINGSRPRAFTGSYITVDEVLRTI